MNILSIQSSVATGHVGNSAAVFCLQRMGIDVTAINTLQFSNHTGAAFQGDVFPAEHIRKIVAGVDAFSRFDGCRAVLSGYLGNTATGDAVLDAVAVVKKRHPDVLYCCDPVAGDDNKFFIKPDVADFYLKKALNTADIITPNVFEFNFLSKEKPLFVQNFVNAARRLLKNRPLKTVIITGMSGGDFKQDETGVLGISATQAYLVKTPRLNFARPLTGTGDTFTALFLGKTIAGHSLPDALSYASSCIFSLIRKTPDTPSRTIALIENQTEIDTPSHRFDAVKIS